MNQTMEILIMEIQVNKAQLTGVMTQMELWTLESSILSIEDLIGVAVDGIHLMIVFHTSGDSLILLVLKYAIPLKV